MTVSLTTLRGVFAAFFSVGALLLASVGSAAGADATPATQAVAKVPVIPAASAADYDPTRPGSGPPVAPPATSKGAPSGTPVTAARTPPKSFLWEVKSKSGIAYLFGTIHVGKAAFYPLPDTVESAFARSGRIVVEADISREGGLADIQSLITYNSPDTLDQHIPAELYARLNAQLGPLGIPIRAARSMKPFVVGGLLSIAAYQRLGYDMNRGVDAYLIERAKATGKPLLELESPRAQLELLAGMPADLQEAFLDNAITALEKNLSADQVAGMVNAWQSGDANRMEEVSAEVGAAMRLQARIDDVLLHQRHPAMLKKIEGFLAGRETSFVAVGSLHLVGKRGLLQLLRDKGYEVNQK